MIESKLLLAFLVFAITNCDGIESNMKKKTIINGTSDETSNPRSNVLGAVASGVGNKMIAGSVAQYYVSKIKTGLSIVILNNMKDWFLVNPNLFLYHGKTVSPPSLIIPPAAKDECEPKDECLGKILFVEENPRGVLCYEFPTVVGTSTKSLCIYFFLTKKDNHYNILIARHIHDEPPAVGWESLFSARKIGMNLIFEPPTFPIKITAQMTTSENARLFLEIRDQPEFQTSISKRDVVSALVLSLLYGAASGAGASAASALASAASKYLVTKYGTILTLENLSKHLKLFNVYDPIWYQGDNVRVLNIIPWALEPGKSFDVTFTATKTRFVATPVFVLSFAVNQDGFFQTRLVLAIWWPGKYQWYSISWLKSERKEVRKALNKLATVIRNHPMDPDKANHELHQETDFQTFVNQYGKKDRVNYVGVHKHLHYKFWQFPILSEGTSVKGLKVLTAMGNGEKNAMVMKVFDSSWQTKQWEPPLSIPVPVDYKNSAEHNPPM